MESHRPRQPSLARGRPGGATREHGCVAAGAVVPRGGRGAGGRGGGGGGGGQTGGLDAVSVGGHLEILPVHPGGADSPRRAVATPQPAARVRDRKSTRLNSSHLVISYAVFCLKKKNTRLHGDADGLDFQKPTH